jgi:hypothetical protein
MKLLFLKVVKEDDQHSYYLIYVENLKIKKMKTNI